MEYRLEKAGWEQMDEAVFVEENTTPAGCYLKDNARYFLEHTQGDLTIAYAEKTAVGIGKLSVLPDGSGWLETLRVLPAWQSNGVGKAIYSHWEEEADRRKLSALRMFTGEKNLRSKGLAERFGFSLAGRYIGASAPAVPSPLLLERFGPVEDFAQAKVLLESERHVMNDFAVLNNTFFRHGEQTWRYLFENKMIYADQNGNFAVVGARMLRERGLHLVLYGGDPFLGLRFAKALAYHEQLPEVTFSYPPENTRLAENAGWEGFVHDASARIVMERVL